MKIELYDRQGQPNVRHLHRSHFENVDEITCENNVAHHLETITHSLLNTK